MTTEDGFVFTGILDGKGGARVTDAPDPMARRTDGLVEWVHLDITRPAARDWLKRAADLPPLAVGAILAPETEPRHHEFDSGTLIILREVNTHDNADPDDMISLRLWVGHDRIVTGRLRHLEAIEDIKTALAAGTGPMGKAQFLCAVGRAMAQTKTEIIAALNEELDDIDEGLTGGANLKALFPRIADLRRRAIQLNRYFRPQRLAIAEIAASRPPWLDEMTAEELSELAAEFNRLAADIDAILGRAQVTQDEMRSTENQRATDITLTLTVVAAIFLPLGFVTGLLGINVGGIPLAESKAGFWVVCGGLLALGICLWLYFRNRRYL